MTARKTPATKAEPPASDSTGITGAAQCGTALVLRLDQMAAHPANPRGEDLGDLAELQASVAEIGVLEPIVVATVAAHLAGGWPAVADGAEFVILAGHRRHAAAIGAGLSEVPCVVRDDLAGDDALTVMLSENDPAKRHGLTPLAEAGAFRQLAERGWSQRKIAARVGCGQAHVSKRLTLLKLPGEAIEALAAGEITPADCAELARLCSAGHPGRAVEALKEIDGSAFYTAESVVTRHLAKLATEQQAAQTRAQMEAEGIRVIAPADLGPMAYTRRLRDSADLEPHREAGCLTGVARGTCRELYCADPSSHEGTAAALPGAAQADGYAAAEAARTEEARQSTAAARSRKAAAGQLAVRAVTVARAAELVSAALLARHADAQCLETAVKWLRAADIGSAEGDYYDYADQVTAAGDRGEIRRLAVAMALASDERAAGGQGGFAGRWEAREIAYVDRLIAEAGYEPGDWERARLAEARGRVTARPGLSCPVCGCRADKRCGQFLHLPNGAYAKCDAEPAEDGSWSYRCACGGIKAGAGVEDEAGETRDRLFEALELLLISIDPNTAAALELPGGLEEIIATAADAFTEAYDNQGGNEDPGRLIAAARDLHAAAVQLEADWPPHLRAAFDALAECGVIESAAGGQVADRG